VAPLVPKEILLERLDFRSKNAAEAACCCIWVWAKDPDGIAKSGTLELEAVSERTDDVWHFNWKSGPSARRPVNLLPYNVLLHLDRVIDFRPTAPGAEWPKAHNFIWHFGVKDGDRPASRPSVHSRLGPRKRDRSPPGDGGRASEDDTASSHLRGIAGLRRRRQARPSAAPWPRPVAHTRGPATTSPPCS
jgi:hypothetical protein